MASRCIACWGIITCAILASCARPEVHIHDRHSLSFPLVESYAKKHPDTTLVLLDYHHDVGPIGEGTLSSNWVAMLLRDKSISRVIWVSGRDLLLPNRNARIAWLRRKLASYPPSESAQIEDSITLTDWHELETRRLGGPLVVSLDFDLFCHDPGNPPERFVDEIGAWIGKQRPSLVTLALSAAYESDPKSAWRRLERLINGYSEETKQAVWFLEAGPRSLSPQGVEENEAWQIWENHKELFGRRDQAFFPGAYIWIAPPVTLRSSLLAIDVKAGDETAQDVLAGWRDKDFVDLERQYPQIDTDEILVAAAAALEGSWKGEPPVFPKNGIAALGVALRIQKNGGDRGCFSLYCDVIDPLAAVAYCTHFAAKDPRYPAILPSERSGLDLELSIFGLWKKMKDPFDFRPGLDSLILVDGGETTLLQSPIAVERGYGRQEFLARLSNKAGLGLEGWRKQNLRFLRSATIWSKRPLSSIEATSDYQKYEKK